MIIFTFLKIKKIKNKEIIIKNLNYINVFRFKLSFKYKLNNANFENLS